MLKKLLLSLFSLLLLVNCTGTSDPGCALRTTAAGNGEAGQESRQLHPFDTLVVDLSAARVELVQGEASRVELQGDSNLFKRIRTKSHNGTLTVDSGYCLQPEQALVVRITTPDLDRITLIDAQSLASVNTLSTERLTLESSGDSKIDLSLIAGNLEVNSDGASQLLLSGTVNQGTFQLRDEAGVSGSEMRVAEADVALAGSGRMTLHVDKALSADLSGSGDLKILGNPSLNHYKGGGNGSLSLRR